MCPGKYQVQRLISLGSAEQRTLVELPILSWICLVSVICSFFVAALIFVMQMREERERQVRELMASRARRLRYKKNGKEVYAPVLEPPLRYHIFLSHFWG